jgi:hypothetical protein
MASGYKGFRQIYQESNRRLKELKKQQEMKTTTDNLKKFASFLFQHPTINGYMQDKGNTDEANGAVKQGFKTLGKKAFKELAIVLGLTQYDVHFNPGGPAVSGDLILMGMFTADNGIYISLNKDGMRSGVLYRSIKSMKDYSGGLNNYFPEGDLNHPEEIKDKIYRLLKLDRALTATTLSDLNVLPNVSVVTIANKVLPIPEEHAHEETENISDVKSTNGSGQNTSTTLDLLTGDAWFEGHPEKVLGLPYQTTQRFGKPITKVKGSIDNIVQGINVPSAAIMEEPDEPLQTEIKEPLEQLLTDPEKRNNIERVVQKAKKDQAEKALRKLNDQNESVFDAACPEGALCFDDILKQYNKNISEDEIKAWIWYKRKSGGLNDERVILNKKNGWSKFVIPLAEIDHHLKGWIENGIICYQNGEYIPSVLYYAENIYERQASLLKEKDVLISKYGQKQYERQWDGLENIKPPKLTLTDPVVENRLFIKPDSAFAKEIHVQQLADGTTFSVYSEKEKSFVKEAMSLVKAFSEWLDTVPKTEFKKSTAFNIINYYLNGKTPSTYHNKSEKLRLRQNAKTEGSQFFVRFLAEALTREDQLKIEHLWNARYNGYVEINYFKIPVAFHCSSTFKNKPLFIRALQREGLGFINVQGSGCIAYDVGLGKTMTGILAIAQALEMGQCKRPFIVVPNQTYKNWLSEIRGVVDNGKLTLTGLLPQYQVIDLYNLGTEYLEQLQNEKGVIQPIPEYTISVMTYEGFNRLSFNAETWKTIGSELYAILNQRTDKKRDQQKLFERIHSMMGKGIKGGMVDIEELGFDYMIVDEAHAMKKSFTQVKGQIKDDGKKKAKNRYDIRSGKPSMTALRGFMISHYIQRKNNMRNVVLLTATPFTNSPLEIYSILALIGYQQLENGGIKNIQQFFDTFIKTSNELIINAKLKPERREIVLGFHNLIALQQLIYKFITYKTGEEAKIQRPNKIVLPLLNKREGDNIIALPSKEQISTNLPMTVEQKGYMEDVENYVKGNTSLRHFCVNPHGYEEEENNELSGEGEPLDEEDLSDEEQEGTRILRGMSFARQLALSPYLYACNPNHNPTYTEYIESSPKLKYVMECIRSVKSYHEERKEDISGQIIYMNAGIHFFPLIKEYLVKKVGYQEHEIGIINSSISSAKKEGIKERFLAGSIKIIIGSGSIKEGINLQTLTSVLYNCWLEWNPTDIKQLEGRAWRFGNIYANIRIVIPLMEDSIDTFIFQKLQEKTSRINEIWYRAGKSNTLNLEEFNPAELKMALITDPFALAELMLLTEKEQLLDDITGLNNEKIVLTEIAEQRDIFNKNIGHIKEIVSEYKPMKEGQSRNIETVLKLFRDYLDDEDTAHNYQDDTIFDQVRKANTVIKRGIDQVLAPRGLDISFDLKKLTTQMDKEIEKINNDLMEKTGKEAIQKKGEEIIEQRIKKDYKPKTVMERVKEFASLNSKLLSQLMIYDNSEGAKEKKDQQLKHGQGLESASDAVEELEAYVKAIAELDKILTELEGLRKTAQLIIE